LKCRSFGHPRSPLGSARCRQWQGGVVRERVASHTARNTTPSLDRASSLSMLTHQSSTLAARTECHPAIEPSDTTLRSVAPAAKAGAIVHVADAKDTQLLQGSIYEHYEIGSNGVGKTMLAKNIAHQALIAGHTVLCTVALGRPDGN
jgi:hypothetical protein